MLLLGVAATVTASVLLSVYLKKASCESGDPVCSPPSPSSAPAQDPVQSGECRDQHAAAVALIEAGKLASGASAVEKLRSACPNTSAASQLQASIQVAQASASRVEVLIRVNIAKGDLKSATSLFNELVLIDREYPGIRELRIELVELIRKSDLKGKLVETPNSQKP